MQSFAGSFWEGNIYRYVLSTKIYVWSINAIEVVLVFSKKDFKPVNMCLDHTHDKIAVQNNALISSIIFTLKQAKIAVQNNALMSSIIFTLKQAKMLSRITP